MNTRISPLLLAMLTLLAADAGAGEPASSTDDISRTADGRPDLSGNYNVATLTPLERPAIYGDKLSLTRAEAEEIVAAEAARRDALALPSDASREAPPKGGDGSPGAYGNVGGYNYFWIDRGTDVFELDANSARRSSPTRRTAGSRADRAGQGEAAQRAFLFPPNEGRAFWMKDNSPGPYDDIEQRRSPSAVCSALARPPDRR